MTHEELKKKYSRIPSDLSQIEMLKDQLLEVGVLDVAQINIENAGKMIGFDEEGKLTVSEVESGTKLYKHEMTIEYQAPNYTVTYVFISNSNVELTASNAFTEIEKLYKNSIIRNAYAGGVLTINCLITVSGPNLLQTVTNSCDYSTGITTVTNYTNVKTITDTVTEL